MENENNPDVHICNPIAYYAHRIRKGGWGYVWSRTSSGYPRVFSLGYYSRAKHRIVVCRLGNWMRRLDHEQGHARGEVHTWRVGFVMHPFGLLRGGKW